MTQPWEDSQGRSDEEKARICDEAMRLANQHIADQAAIDALVGARTAPEPRPPQRRLICGCGYAFPLRTTSGTCPSCGTLVVRS